MTRERIGRLPNLVFLFGLVADMAVLLFGSNRGTRRLWVTILFAIWLPAFVVWVATWRSGRAKTGSGHHRG